MGKMNQLRILVLGPLLYGLMFWGSFSTDTFAVLGFIMGAGLFMSLLTYLKEYRGKGGTGEFIRDALYRRR